MGLGDSDVLGLYGFRVKECEDVMVLVGFGS